MIAGGVYAQNAILGAAMQAAVVRESVISHNMANNDTPGYKKYGVDFEGYLRKAVSDYNQTGVLNLADAKPVVSRIHTNLSTRLDGNNVDINEESISQYQNSVVYDALTNSVIANYKLLNLVFAMK